MISEVVIKSNMTFGLWELPSIQCFQYILWFIQSHSPNFLIQCKVNIWSCTVRYEESASQNKSTPVEYTQLLLTVLLVLNLSYEYERVNWYGMPEITFFFFFWFTKNIPLGLSCLSGFIRSGGYVSISAVMPLTTLADLY